LKHRQFRMSERSVFAAIVCIYTFGRELSTGVFIFNYFFFLPPPASLLINRRHSDWLLNNKYQPHMKARILSKIIVIVLLGLLIGVWSYNEHAKRGRLGRDIFLVEQGARYDRFFAHPSPIAKDLFIGVFSASISFGFYEAMVFCCSKFLERVKDEESS
jgi:hypothetical protein